MKTFTAVVLTAGLTASGFIAMDAFGAVLNNVVAERDGTTSADALPSPQSAISSDSPGALKSPENWTCDYLLPDYRAWLDEGNDPKDWPMTGVTYKDANTGRTYTFTDWIDYINKHHCSPVALARPEVFPVFSSLLGPLLGAAAAGGTIGATTSGAGSANNDSPG